MISYHWTQEIKITNYMTQLRRQRIEQLHRQERDLSDDWMKSRVFYSLMQMKSWPSKWTQIKTAKKAQFSASLSSVYKGSVSASPRGSSIVSWLCKFCLSWNRAPTIHLWKRTGPNSLSRRGNSKESQMTKWLEFLSRLRQGFRSTTGVQSGVQKETTQENINSMDYLTLTKERLWNCFSGYFYKWILKNKVICLNDLSMTLKVWGERTRYSDSY